MVTYNWIFTQGSENLFEQAVIYCFYSDLRICMHDLITLAIEL
jgi:hypothetical protein